MAIILGKTFKIGKRNEEQIRVQNERQRAEALRKEIKNRRKESKVNKIQSEADLNSLIVAPAQDTASDFAPDNSGNNTMLYVGIGVGILAIGGITYLLLKRRK